MRKKDRTYKASGVGASGATAVSVLRYTAHDPSRPPSHGIDLHAPVGEVSKKLLGYLDFFSKGNHDDRTMVLLYPHDPPAAP